MGRTSGFDCNASLVFQAKALERWCAIDTPYLAPAYGLRGVSLGLLRNGGAGLRRFKVSGRSIWNCW